MRASRRLLLIATVCFVVPCVAGGCGRPATRAPATRAPAVRALAVRAPVSRSFSAMGLTFRYPSAWRTGVWPRDVSSFSALVVALGTERMSDPCVPAGAVVTCGLPITALPAGGILVEWRDDGFPGWRAPAMSTVIGGHPASETLTRGGWCASAHGSEDITVIIPWPARPDDWFQMDACLRGPGLAAARAAVADMLGTVRVAMS